MIKTFAGLWADTMFSVFNSTYSFLSSLEMHPTKSYTIAGEDCIYKSIMGETHDKQKPVVRGVSAAKTSRNKL